jgi:hypothetical protein
MMTAFSASDFERLRSWALEITATLLPNVKTRDEGKERRWLGKGGFTINLRTGAWYSHTDKLGSYSAVALIKFLCKCSLDEATQWAAAWLAAHPGTGECTALGADDEAAPASRADAERILREVVDISGTPAETYLKVQRRIDPPYPAGVKYWPNARCGEGAIVFLLTSNARVVGVQVGYLDPDGNKSVIAPQRRRFMLEKAPACFEIPSPGNGPAELVIACGIEDALAIHRWGRRSGGARQWRVIGLPGDGALRHVRIDKGTVVTVVRDADVDNPAADRAIAEGLDHLLLQTGYAPEWASTPAPASVFVTKTCDHGKDANAILIDKGVDGLTALLDDIEKAELSNPRGAIRWLAKLDRLDCDVEVKRAAKALGIRTAVLRAEIADWRKRAGEDAASEPEDDGLLDEEIDLASTLDGILAEMKRYIVAPDTLLGAAAVWAAFTHLVHSERVWVPVAPRLGIQAKSPGCGKTLLLEVLNCLVFNPRASASITVSTVLRTFGIVKPTMLIDEAHGLLRAHEKGELLSLLNAGHYRWNAWIERSVQTPNGNDWVVQRFSVWGTMAYALIGDLPQEQQERAISITLRKVLAKDVPDRLRHGSSAELKRRHAELATWAAPIEELPEVEMPAVLKYQPGRVFDNWEPILQIAELAGGRWPDLIRNAIDDAVNSERAPAPDERVLGGIKKAFERADVFDKKSVDRLATTRLISLMLDDEEEEWAIENRGRPINAYWLRRVLRGHLDPSGVCQWEDPRRDGMRGERYRGYFRSQFMRAWETYLSGDDRDARQDSEYRGDAKTHAGDAGGAWDAGEARGTSAVQGSSVPPHCEEVQHAREHAQKKTEVPPSTPPHTPRSPLTPHAILSGSLQLDKSPEAPEVGGKTRAKRAKPKGAAKPLNGSAQGQSRTDAVRSILAMHPDWDIKQVAAAMGQSVRNIGVAFKHASQA